jgi:TfoX/Sxy family transcriptional regulator of competence genes
VRRLDGVELRTMFGYGAFAFGNMFASLFGDHVILRVPASEREDLARRHGARPFEPLPGRPMREYVELPKPLRDSPPLFRKWLERGRAYAASLPKKKTTPKKGAAR